MKKIKLTPFVYKIKGDKYYALFDLLRQKVFKIIPEGNIEDLKKQLLQADLAMETNGVIPFKFEVSIENYKKFLTLRELQLRITGCCDASCSNCGTICSCYKGGGEISEELLTNIFKQIENITIENILITGGNPATRFDIIENIRRNITASKFSMLYQGTLNSNEKEQLKKLGIEYFAPIDRQVDIVEENMKVDPFTFFYHQAFNPCWGNKMAIDWDGSIKACLWCDDTIGNIPGSNIRDMIIAGNFDKYWELTKDNIQTCKDCEYRYICTDCRVLTIKNTGSLYAKHPSCRYDPSL